MGRKIACFNAEQQAAYDKLIPKHQLYVDYRGLGYSKSEAYRCAGYGVKNAKNSSYQLEKTNSVIRTLIDVLHKHSMASHALAMVDGEYQRESDRDADREHQMTATATQMDNDIVLEKMQNMDIETADRIRFYRDIMNGRVKTKRETITYDAGGTEKNRKVEYIDDVQQRINARKELDKILGIGQLHEMGHINAGQITINIVDASKASVERQIVQDQESVIEPDSVVVESEDGDTE